MKTRINIEKILVILILVLMSFTICLQCGTNPIISQLMGTDSGVFINVAKEMKDGKLIYKDLFDHKGPLLYLLNYIGITLSINNTYSGIWIIEMIFIFIYLLFTYKSINLFVKRNLISVIITCILTTPIVSLLEGGNLVEEYALPFIAISLYYFLKYLIKEEKINLLEMIITGACLGCVILLRPNMITLWIVYCIYIFIDLLIQKKFTELVKFVIGVATGALIVIGICLICLQIQGVLMDCIDDYIIFNFKYSVMTENNISIVITWFATKTNLISLSLFLSLVNLYITKGKEYKISIINIFFFILTLIIIIMPRNLYAHYGMIILPTFAVPFAIITDKILSVKFKKSKIIPVITLILILISFIIICNFMKKNETIITYRKTNPYSELCKVIENNTDKDEQIIVVGNRCSFYLETNRKSVSKYAYQYPVIYINEDVKNTVIEDIEHKKPKLIIYDTGYCANNDARDTSKYSEKLKDYINDLIQDDVYKEIYKEKVYKVFKLNQ